MYMMLRVTFVLCALFCPLLLAATVTIPVGSDAQSIVNANPAGTTYSIASGVHQYFSVRPKSNDKYIGQPGAIVSGGRTLTNWQFNGRYYYVTGQTQKGQQHGDCDKDRRCEAAEDLFMDRRPLIHAANLSAVTTGGWFFDYDADIIYMNDNPNGHTMETSVTRAAFSTPTSAPAQNVTIQNVYVQMYAIPAQMGAIGDQYPGEGWIIANCTFTLNHGTGVQVASRGQILYSTITLNGQKGMGGNGHDILVQGNSISFNNYAGFNVGWEGGGSKFSGTQNLIVRDNHSFNNTGDGLWTDIDNIDALYEGNWVEYNQQNGIAHEISYTATIRNNYLRGNGYAFNPWLWGSQILVQNSQNVSVYNNIVVVDKLGNGISIIYQNRGTGKYGAYIPLNNHVTNNQVYHTFSAGASGAVRDVNPFNPAYFGTLTFNGNHYHVPNPAGNFFAWNNRWVPFSGFQSGSGAVGQEPQGTIDANNTAPAPPNLPSSPYGTPAPTPKPTLPPASPFCTIFFAAASGSSIRDSNGSVWTITSGAQIAVNGVVDPITNGVVKLAYINNLVWQMNNYSNWYSKTLPSSPYWNLTHVDPTVPACVTPNCALYTSTADRIYDQYGNMWQLTSGAQIAVNGAVDSITSGVVKIAEVAGVFWQQNNATRWYFKKLPSDIWTYVPNAADPTINCKRV